MKEKTDKEEDQKVVSEDTQKKVNSNCQCQGLKIVTYTDLIVVSMTILKK